MLRPLRTTAALVVFLAAASCASAHFLWIDARPEAKGLLVQAGFGEPANWEAEMLDKIETASYWLRTAEGADVAVKLEPDADDGCLAATSDQKGVVAVLGACDYGVVQFGKGGPFYLTYYAKRLVGAPDRWAHGSGSENVAIEVNPTLTADGVRLQVMASGRPVPEASLKVYGPKSDRVTLTADADGVALWPNEGSGRYMLFVGHDTKKAGSHDGKDFETSKDYATLMFDVP